MKDHSESSQSSRLMILDDDKYYFFFFFLSPTPRKEKPPDWKPVARSSRDNRELETSTTQAFLLPQGGVAISSVLWAGRWHKHIITCEGSAWVTEEGGTRRYRVQALPRR